MHLTGQRAIVTGASSGIGRAIAKELASCGVRVIATARRRERLEELRDQCRGFPGDLFIVPGDVTDPALRQSLLEAARDLYGGLDLLVNNAGLGGLGPFAEADEKRLREIFETNFFAPLELIRAALPMLAVGRSPMVVNIGSVLGHFAVPNKSEYCASKFALHGFSDSLRAELRKDGIGVLLVSPSTTTSEFFDSARSGAGPKSVRSRLKALRSKGMSAETVAGRTVRAIRGRRGEVILSLGGKLGVWADRLAPTWFNRLMAKYAP